MQNQSIGISRRLGIIAALLWPALPGVQAAQNGGGALDRYTREYSDLLERVRSGDKQVDFREFRVAGAAVSAAKPATMFMGRSPGAGEFQAHRQFTDLIAKGDYGHALQAAEQALERNYASYVGHLDALVACEAQHETEKAAVHRKMADALAASIASSGNGLAPASAWFVVTLPEEYAFLNRITGESPQPPLAGKWGALREASSFTIENGLAYDVLEIDTEDTGPRRFWFDVGTLTGPPPSGMIPGPDATPVLSGRLALRIPASAKPAARQASIMAAQESSDDESRTVFDFGPERMVVLISETFSRSAGDFEAALSKKLNATPARVAAWSVNQFLRAFAYWPTEDSCSSEANLTMGMYVARPDKTVQHVGFYLNPAACQERQAWETLAEKIASTVTNGPKSLYSSGSEAHLAGIVAPVPNGYVVTNQRGPDFWVYHMRKITRFGDPAASLNIYIGNYPQGIAAGPEVRSIPAKLLGAATVWYQAVRVEKGETVFSGQALMRLSGGSPPQRPPYPRGPGAPHGFTPSLYAHIFLNSGSSADNEELKRIAASMHMERPAPAASAAPAHDLVTIPQLWIRVRNGSSENFQNVRVADKLYGNIKAGAVTSYLAWTSAYGYEPVALKTTNGPLAISAVDHTGDPKLDPGHYTYVLKIRDGHLASGLERDGK